MLVKLVLISMSEDTTLEQLIRKLHSVSMHMRTIYSSSMGNEVFPKMGNRVELELEIIMLLTLSEGELLLCLRLQVCGVLPVCPYFMVRKLEQPSFLSVVSFNLLIEGFFFCFL